MTNYKFTQYKLELVYEYELDSASNDLIIWDLHDAYHKVHGWLSLVVCVFGILSNKINVIILNKTNIVIF
jgi:hypothetical protein